MDSLFGACSSWLKDTVTKWQNISLNGINCLIELQGCRLKEFEINYEWSIDHSQIDFFVCTLVTSHSIHTLQTLKVSNLLWMRKDLCFFVLDEKLKLNWNSIECFWQCLFFQDPRLCVIRCLREYLQSTKKDRGEIDYLLITTIRQFRPVKHDTIGNWVTNTLKDSGIDVNVFKPHSTRGDSVSKYVSLKVPVDHILSEGQWSVKSTFHKFYDKQILPQRDISQKFLNNFVENNQ